MSQEAVDLSQAAFEQFTQGDFSAIADLSDEFELVLAPEMPDAGTYRGGAARQWITAWVNSFDRLTQEPVEFIDAGGHQVLVEFIQRGWTAGSDVPVETRTWSLSTVKDGDFLRTQLFQNRSDALEAAGLSGYAMSQENVESFKRFVKAWNHDDFDAWIDHLDPEVEWFTLVEVYRGHAGARKAWESLKGTMQIRARFDDIRDLGESVLALGEMEGTGQTTRLDFTGELAELVTYRGGKVVNIRDFRSHAEALEAAGLEE